MNNSCYEPIGNGVRRPVVLRGLILYISGCLKAGLFVTGKRTTVTLHADQGNRVLHHMLYEFWYVQLKENSTLKNKMELFNLAS